MSQPNRLSLTATVGARGGLHARPAAQFVQAAARQPVRVTVGRPGQDPVDARSLLSVLGLAAKHGDELLLSTDGEAGAAAVLDELAALISAEQD
ncbi:HPr family phosphocarrier protein [Phaeacidiphilus oryzae]|jgi:phosphocarrier protein|uniref:HPr family phosphocarrier protein n=1 Tax=Phaeacidiphilus oryzae TaxID=348818 RepID=UPI0005676E52|nr:HPr family phosphocarrier protein [Phaeacidiphilus oryzae]